jgi:hypothetical protein
MHNDLMIRVADHPNLVRDRHSNAILDIDEESYKKYQAQKAERLNQKVKIQEFEQKLNRVESELSDIKSLLVKILEK